MQFELVYLILGLVGLLIGSELVVNGTLNIAKHYKISHLFLGLIVLAVGTNLPELIVTINGAIYRLNGIETSGIVVGDLIGSCFAQIGLILGILGLIGVISLTKKEIKRDCVMMIGSVALLIFVSLDKFISKAEGLMLVFIFCLYLLNVYREEKLYEKMKRAPKMHLMWDIFSIIGGFIIIYFGSGSVVKNGISLANSWGVSQTIIGITIIGLGTSLPELVVSLNALRKGAVKLSAANLIGSNILDSLFVLGIGAGISGLNINHQILIFDMPLLLLFSIIVVYFFIRNMRVEKKEAIALLAIYFIYLGVRIFVKF